MKRKKSKYKACVLEKKKYYFYEIIWIDIVGDSGHATFDEFSKMECATMVTNAFLFKKDKKFIWTFGSYDIDMASFSDRNKIPLACVVKMTKVLL